MTVKQDERLMSRLLVECRQHKERIAELEHEVEGSRAKRCQRPVPTHCDYDDCTHRPLWSVQHEEYADHLPPDFACGLHLSRICTQSEYEEGDALIVDRVRFSV
jgi:hypothetical protein